MDTLDVFGAEDVEKFLNDVEQEQSQAQNEQQAAAREAIRLMFKRAHRIGKVRDILGWAFTVTLLVAVWAIIALPFAIKAATVQLKREADAQNYANQIMVGLENGKVPAPGQFRKADPPKSF